jgi:hypothetical protein
MLRLMPLLLFALLCVGCETLSTQTEGQSLQVTLTAYANALRWGGFDQAVKYVDPETLKQHPLTPLDLERYKQVSVISYSEQAVVPVSKHEVSQLVEIGVLNVNTQTERAIVDRQLWRYDEKTKHWHIVSGLPDITQH